MRSWESQRESLGVSQKCGTSIAGWFLMEKTTKNLLNIDDLEVPP